MNREAITQILKKPAVLVGAASVVSASAGAILGYRVAVARLQAEFEEEAGKQIEAAKEYYASMRVVNDVKPTPQEILEQVYSTEAQEAREAHESYLGNNPGEEDFGAPVVAAETISEPVQELQVEAPKNVFAGKEPVEEVPGEWDYERELAIRAENPDKPYIIHHDEYFENETEYEQGSLTYYEGDDTLVDEKDMPVGDDTNVVGDDALTAFGHGSKDKNVVYVRNESLEMDFEIVRSNGKFSVEVLGFDDEEGESLQHSHRRPNRRFRMEHDD